MPDNKRTYKNKIKKTGPNLNGREDSFSILSRVRTDLVTIGNNHILDYGSTGLEDTLNGLKNNLINFVGARASLNEAKKAFCLNENGLKVTFLNFAENEWSSAGQRGLDPIP